MLQAVRLDEATECITVDGRLDDPAWARAPMATDFYQHRQHTL